MSLHITPILKSIGLILVLIFDVFPTSAVKLNQRGEKMVSRLNVTHLDSHYSTYSIKFGYNKTNEINILEYERKRIENEIVKMGRTNEGEIWRKDFVDGREEGYYTFKTDIQGRPLEMRWYSRNILGKNTLSSTFIYDYTFQDYTLSIVHINTDDKWAGLRELVCEDNGNAYMLRSVINLETKGESKPVANYRGLAYSDTINDLNIDLSQIVGGYSRVVGSFMISVDSNFMFLVNWTNTKSRNLITILDKYKLEYVIDGNGNIIQVLVRSVYTERLFYTISITYVSD